MLKVGGKGYCCKALVLFLPVFFCALSVVGQSDTLKAADSSYFNDGDLSLRTYVLKIELLPAIVGAVKVNVERKIGELFAAEVGVGIVFPGYLDVNDWIMNPERQENVLETGGGFQLACRYYFRPQAMNYYYGGLVLEYRHFGIKNSSLRFLSSDIQLVLGRQIYITNRLVVDLNGGIGTRYDAWGKSIVNTEGADLTSIILGGSLKIGLLL